MAKLSRADLAGSGSLGGGGGGVGVETAERGGEHAGRESGLAHGEQHHRRFGVGSGEGQDARIIGRLARGGDYFVAVGREAGHAPQQRVERGSPAVVVIGDQQVSAAAQGFHALHAIFGAFDFDVDGFRSGVDRGFENAQLFLDTAVVAAMILMAAAGGEDGAIGVAREEFADRGDALLG